MHVRFLTLLVLSLLAAPAQAQTLDVPENVEISQPGLVLVRVTKTDCDALHWWHVDGPVDEQGGKVLIQEFPPDIITPKLGTYFGLAITPGVYKVGVIGAKAVEGKSYFSPMRLVAITVKGKLVPPTPGPGPNPPTPPVPPNPTPDGKMKVLILYESSEAPPAEQQAILVSTDPVRKYLNEHCDVDETGKKAWRFWDKDTPPAGAPKWAQDLAAKKYATTRRVVFQLSSSQVFDAELPQDIPAMMALLKSKGGE